MPFFKMQQLRIIAAEEDLDVIQKGKTNKQTNKDFHSGDYELLSTGSTTWEQKN